MFAEILYKGVSMQLKQGLYREYVQQQDTLPLIKGKVDINGTIRARIQRKQLVSCEFDELSEDNNLNRILKSTLEILISNESVKAKRKLYTNSRSTQLQANVERIPCYQYILFTLV